MQKAWRFPCTGHTVGGEAPHNIISCLKSCFASKTLKELATMQSCFPLTCARHLEQDGRLRDAKCNANPGE
jgi:hypothetical protein